LTLPLPLRLPLRHLDRVALFLVPRKEAPDSVQATDVIQATAAAIGLALDGAAVDARFKRNLRCRQRKKT